MFKQRAVNLRGQREGGCESLSLGEKRMNATFLYVCVCVCMHVSLCAWQFAHLCVCVCVCTHVSLRAWQFARLCVCHVVDREGEESGGRGEEQEESGES